MRPGRVHQEASQHLAYDAALSEIIEVFRDYFDITFGRTSHDFNTTVHFVFLKPHEYCTERFGFSREVLLAYCPYPELQPRVFQNITDFMRSAVANVRVDPVAFILVSKAKNRRDAVQSFLLSSTEIKIPILVDYETCVREQSGSFIVREIERQLFARDMYDVTETRRRNEFSSSQSKQN